MPPSENELFSFETFDEEEEFEEEGAAETNPLTFIMWLVAIGTGILFLPLYQIFSSSVTEIERLTGEIVALEQRVDSINRPAPEMEALSSEISAGRLEIEQLKALYPTLEAAHFDWSGIMTTIGQYDQTVLRLDEIRQSGNQLILSGKGLNDLAVIDYADRLGRSGYFLDVEIRSMALSGDPLFTPTPSATPTETETVTPSPTPTDPPTAEPSPTSTSAPADNGGGSGGGSGGAGGGAIPTPQPPLFDAFEPDDTIPGSVIFLGETQSRNFFPEGDVDLITFLVKAGRTYRIQTLNLAPGVDTQLLITLGESQYENDDAQPGTLASEIVLVGGDQDRDALIQVLNLGLFMPDKVYQIAVEEILPTPTPQPAIVPTDTPTVPPSPTPIPPTATATPLPTETASATPTATGTSSPTATGTPTAVPVDLYEPNDEWPSGIAIGETQIHTFAPADDVDKVTFATKAGRYYKLYTGQLSLGVDTFITAKSFDEVWENDDRFEPGSGNLSSGLCMPSDTDDSILATISNRAEQYGADKRYALTLEEVPVVAPERETINFGQQTAGSITTVVETVTVNRSQPVEYTTSVSADWIELAPLGAGDQISVTLDPALTQTGLLTGTIRLTWAELCQTEILVEVEVVAASSSSGPIESVLHSQLPVVPAGYGRPIGIQQNRPAFNRQRLPEQVVPTQNDVTFVVVLTLRGDLPPLGE